MLEKPDGVVFLVTEPHSLPPFAKSNPLPTRYFTFVILSKQTMTSKNSFGCRKNPLQFQLTPFFCVGEIQWFLRQPINQSESGKGVCRTTPTGQGVLKRQYYGWMRYLYVAGWTEESPGMYLVPCWPGQSSLVNVTAPVTQETQWDVYCFSSFSSSPSFSSFSSSSSFSSLPSSSSAQSSLVNVNAQSLWEHSVHSRTTVACGFME